MKILASTNQVIYLLTAEPPTHSDLMASTPKSETTDMFPVRLTRIASIPQIECHDQANPTKPERVTGIINKRTKNDGPAFNPMNSYWLHHRPKVSPMHWCDRTSPHQVRQGSTSNPLPAILIPWEVKQTRVRPFSKGIGHILKNTANRTYI